MWEGLFWIWGGFLFGLVFVEGVGEVIVEWFDQIGKWVVFVGLDIDFDWYFWYQCQIVQFGQLFGWDCYFGLVIVGMGCLVDQCIG